MSDFEKIYNIKLIKNNLFYELYQDIKDPEKYFITLDYNIIKHFYSKNIEEAIIYYENFLKNK